MKTAKHTWAYSHPLQQTERNGFQSLAWGSKAFISPTQEAEAGGLQSEGSLNNLNLKKKRKKDWNIMWWQVAGCVADTRRPGSVSTAQTWFSILSWAPQYFLVRINLTRQ